MPLLAQHENKCRYLSRNFHNQARAICEKIDRQTPVSQLSFAPTLVAASKNDVNKLPVYRADLFSDNYY